MNTKLHRIAVLAVGIVLTLSTTTVGTIAQCKTPTPQPPTRTPIPPTPTLIPAYTPPPTNMPMPLEPTQPPVQPSATPWPTPTSPVVITIQPSRTPEALPSATPQSMNTILQQTPEPTKVGRMGGGENTPTPDDMILVLLPETGGLELTARNIRTMALVLFVGTVMAIVGLRKRNP